MLTAQLDFAVDDLNFVSASFQPDLIRLINHNDFSIYRGYAATASELDTSVRRLCLETPLTASSLSSCAACVCTRPASATVRDGRG